MRPTIDLLHIIVAITVNLSGNCGNLSVTNLKHQEFDLIMAECTHNNLQ